MKKSDIESEEQLKRLIELMKKEDPLLAEKLTKFYEKSCDLDRISEDIIKYLSDVDKVNSAIEKFKSLLHPVEHKLTENIKRFEVSIKQIVQIYL